MGYLVLISRKSRKSSPSYLEKDDGVLDDLDARFASTDRSAVNWVADKDAVQDMDMPQHYVLDDCYPCIEGAVTNTIMPSRTHGEVRPASVIHTNVTIMSVPQMDRERYFVSRIDEVLGHVRISCKKSKTKQLSF